MPEKGEKGTLLPLHQWRFGLLTALVFVGIVVVWSIDGCTFQVFIKPWRFKQDYINVKVSPLHDLSQNFTQIFGISNLNKTLLPISHPNKTHIPPFLNKQKNVTFSDSSISSNNTSTASELKWISGESEANFTENLLLRWKEPGGKPCKDSRTAEIAVPGLDGRGFLELAAGEIHEYLFHAIDESGNARCFGGDYFEADLSGQSWKSRPPVKDFGNGSYSISIQIHPDLTGDYNLTLILLFRHFEGLKISPSRFAYDRELRHLGIRFYKSKAFSLPELQICQKSDFSRDVWSGRWTRHGKNDDCEISYDGRFRCLPADFPCPNPWCSGSLGALESNGWVYSAHCSFILFSDSSAWNCLKNRWIFFWGDSNHVDTIRNMLNFMLNLPTIRSVPRRFDMNFSNPNDPSQTVRITSIFNGHWNETGNYLGLDSLKDEGFRELVKKYFSEDTVPDTIIMNSGLHDGIHWSSVRAFSAGADYAVSFWKEVMESVRLRGLAVPRILFRATVATGGYARAMAFNPSKMEVFNRVFLEKLRRGGLVSGVIDNFDMTFPWHFDNRCNDGVHYGRAPLKMKWRDGEIGHQYFVDLMLGHVLLNALCV